jgi:Zn-dependent protease
MMQTLLNGFLWYVAFLFSTAFHEASHAFAALKLGDRTAYEGGQVSLDPVVHIRREPLGTVVVPILSFLLGGWMIGWASAPYDPQWAYDNPRSSAKMAAAGPAANLILSLIAALAIRIGIFAGFFVPPEYVDYTHIIDANGNGFLNAFAILLNIIFSLNLILFIFNLLPIPPLDGSGIVPFFLDRNHAQNYIEKIHSGAFSLIGIVIAWSIFDYLYEPLHLMFVNLLYFPIAHYQ